MLGHKLLERNPLPPAEADPGSQASLHEALGLSESKLNGLVNPFRYSLPSLEEEDNEEGKGGNIHRSQGMG